MDLIDALTAIVGPQGILLGEAVRQRPNEAMWKGECPARAIIRPATTEEVSQVMKLCHEHKQAIVPMGGLTGLANGTTCQESDIGLSLERMSAIEEFDEMAGLMVVQAGAILQNVQEQAAGKGWQFAVDLGARGSAQIGGNIATNAGGNSVLRNGMMREQILGLEVVLADGTVMSSMNRMLKNNAGYDLKHVFIGSEGTLGIVTRAVLRLRPAMNCTQTALVALNSYEAVTTLLRRLGTASEGKLSAFEVMWHSFYELQMASGKHQEFLPTDYPYYVLVETVGADAEREAEHFMTILSDLMEENVVATAVIAQSSQQAQQLWELRDDIETLAHTLRPPIAFDISLPISDVPNYVSDVDAALHARWSQARLVVFGHLGDNNIHLAVGGVEDYHGVNDTVYQCLEKYRGSVSAEHGIGLSKKPYLTISRTAEEIALMHKLKAALDPHNLLNPGKVIG